MYGTRSKECGASLLDGLLVTCEASYQHFMHMKLSCSVHGGTKKQTQRCACLSVAMGVCKINLDVSNSCQSSGPVGRS